MALVVDHLGKERVPSASTPVKKKKETSAKNQGKAPAIPRSGIGSVKRLLAPPDATKLVSGAGKPQTKAAGGTGGNIYQGITPTVFFDAYLAAKKERYFPDWTKPDPLGLVKQGAQPVSNAGRPAGGMNSVTTSFAARSAPGNNQAKTPSRPKPISLDQFYVENEAANAEKAAIEAQKEVEQARAVLNGYHDPNSIYYQSGEAFREAASSLAAYEDTAARLQRVYADKKLAHDDLQQVLNASNLSEQEKREAAHHYANALMSSNGYSMEAYVNDLAEKLLHSLTSANSRIAGIAKESNQLKYGPQTAMMKAPGKLPPPVEPPTTYRSKEHRADVMAYQQRYAGLFELAENSDGPAWDPYQNEAEKWFEQYTKYDRALHYWSDSQMELDENPEILRARKREMERLRDEAKRKLDELPILLTADSLKNPYVAKYADLLSVRTPNKEQKAQLRQAWKELYPIANSGDYENYDPEAFAASQALAAKLPAAAVIMAAADEFVPWVSEKNMERDVKNLPPEMQQLRYLSTVQATSMNSWQANDIAETGIVAIKIASKAGAVASMMSALNSGLHGVELTKEIIKILAKEGGEEALEELAEAVFSNSGD